MPREPSSTMRFRKIVSPTEAKTLLVVVPGIGTRLPEEWIDDRGNLWLENIPNGIAPDLVVYVYMHELSLSDASPWQKLVDAGRDFLIDLVELLKDTEKLSQCPLVIASHSLGGILVKQGLCLANERSLHFRSLLRAIAGIMLFGTMHSISDEEQSWQNATYAIRPAGTIKKKGLVSKEDAQKLGHVSLQFEQCMNFMPILSIYETQSTKVRFSRMSSDKIILAGKNSVQTSVSREQLLGLDADHRSLCNVDISSDSFEKMCNFIQVGVESARRRILDGSPEYEPQSVLDHLTVRSCTSKESLSLGVASPLEHTLELCTSTTPQATAGSSESYAFELIPRVSDFQALRKDPQIPCHLIPLSRNREFFGRAEVIKAIDHAMLSQSTSRDLTISIANELRAYAICGPAGIGKTQTAAEYVISRKSQFDAILWVHADRTEKLAEGFSQMAISMGLVSEDSVDAKNQVVTRDLVKGWLANPVRSYSNLDKGVEYATWLVIFDNADDPDLLADFWPLNGPGCVLVTSRDPLTKKNGFSTMDGIDLEPFSHEEGAELLVKLSGRKSQVGEEASSIDISELLGGFPLAITQMAGIILRHDLTFPEFLRAYGEEESRAELLGLQLGHASRKTGYEHTLASAWAIETLVHGAVLLDLLSLLDPDGIQETILTSAPQLISLEGFPKTLVAYQKARSELFQSSLVTRDKSEKKLIVHRIIQDTARSKMSNDRFRAIFSVAVTLICSIWPFTTSDWQHGVARWVICEELFPHILRLRRFTPRYMHVEGERAIKFQLSRLLNDAGWYYLERGNPADSVVFYELAEELCASLEPNASSSNATNDMNKLSQIGQVDELYLEICHHTGCAATVTNKPKEALLRFQTFNDILLKLVDAGVKEKKSSLAVSWNELGVAHMMNRQYEKGEECFQRALDSVKKLPDFARTQMSFPMVNLGLAYWLTNRYEESLQVLSEGLQDRQAVFGIDDRTSFITGRFLHALGNVRGAQGFINDSFLYHQRALLQYKSSVGNNHHRTAAMCYKVAEHYIRMQQNDAAMRLLDQALKIYGHHPEYKPEKARALFLKGKLLTILDEPDNARASFDKSFSLYHECLPSDSRLQGDLTTADFEDLVVFWSR